MIEPEMTCERCGKEDNGYRYSNLTFTDPGIDDNKFTIEARIFKNPINHQDMDKSLPRLCKVCSLRLMEMFCNRIK